METMRFMHLLLSSVAVVAALSGCLGDDEDDEGDGNAANGGDGNGMPTNNTTAPVNLSVAVSDMPPNAFRFLPATLTAAANSTVNLTVTSAGGPTGNKLGHNLVISELSVNLGGIAAGETKNVMFNVTAPGTFAYFCDVGNHRQLGMVGTLTVE